MYLANRLDGHGDWADEDTLQTALWDYVRSGDRTLYKQHTSEAVGEWVEITSWSFPVKATLSVPGAFAKSRDVSLPPGTLYLGAIWSPDAWNDVKAGRLAGYSLAGLGRGVVGEVPA